MSSDLQSKMIAKIWDGVQAGGLGLEDTLKEWSQGLRGSSKKNSRLEAWLSDCAMALLEATEESVKQLGKAMVETGDIPTEWKEQFQLLAFRRRVSGWDVGEAINPTKGIEASRYGTDKFWDKVPQNEQPEVDPAKNAEAFEKQLVKLTLCGPRQKNLRKVIHAFCQYPELANTEKAKLSKVKQSTFYYNVESLKTRLTLSGLLMDAAK